MNNFSAWLRQLFSRIGASFRNFMSGRYGTDKLNMVILGSGVLVSLIASFIRLPVVMMLLTMLSYALLIWALFRSFSRNTYKRYEENRRRIADFLLRGLRFVNKQGQPLKMMKPLKLDPALLEQPLYH